MATSVPAPRSRPNTLDTDLGWTLGVIFRAYLKAADDATADLPGGPRGHQVLTAAAHEEPRSQAALAQRLGIDRTVMTYLLDDLVAVGLVQRRPDPADRRTRRVVATEYGCSTLNELDRRLRQVENHVLGSLADDHRDQLRTLLQQVAAHVDDTDPLVHPCAVVEDIGATTAGHHSR